MQWQEYIGLIGSILVLASFIFKKVLIIRSVNLVGAIIFVIYGIIISALSIWLLNSILILIQIYYITNDIKKIKKENTKQNDNNKNRKDQIDSK